MASAISRQNRNARLMAALIIFISDDTLTFGTNENVGFIAVKLFFYLISIFYLLMMINIRLITSPSSIYLILISVLISLTAVMNLDFRGGYIYQLIIILISFLLAEYLDFESFARSFNKLMYVLSIISLIVYMLALNASALLDIFPIHTNAAGLQFTNLYLSGVYKDVGELRNTGLFREPGVFMIYLLLAIIFELFYFVHIRKSYLLIFILCLISTFSTAAFFVLFLVILGYFIASNKINIFKKIVISLVFICSIIAYFIIYSASYISVFGKLNQDSSSYVSFLSRLASFVVNFDIFLTHPLLGVGLNNYGVLFAKYSLERFQVALDAAGESTNTFMSFFATYGIGLGSFILLGTVRFANKINTKNGWSFFLLLSFLMLFSNEDMRYSLLFNTIIFFGLKRSYNKIGVKDSCEIR